MEVTGAPEGNPPPDEHLTCPLPEHHSGSSLHTRPIPGINQTGADPSQLSFSWFTLVDRVVT